MPKTESRAFSVHPHLIFDVINKQAGTLAKAILEGVQNSIDAGATVCKLKITASSFTITDDGRGFADRHEIEEFFEVFGSPHSDEDDPKIFGRFRCGRGQLLSFASTKWRSGKFAMDVDVKTRGLDYTLVEEAEKKYPGCEITGKLYDKLSPSDLLAVKKDVTGLVAWVRVPVMLDGKQINKLPAEENWDEETDDAFIKVRKTGGLKVYNLGAFVCTYPEYRFGINGIVVSKTRLDVNFARNDILTSQCEVWKRIRKKLSTLVEKDSGNSSSTTTAAKEKFFHDFLAGEGDYQKIRKYKLFPDVTGRKRSLEQVLAYNASPVTFAPDVGDRQGDVLAQIGAYMVLTEETLEMFGVATGEELKKKLVSLLKKKVVKDKQESRNAGYSGYSNSEMPLRYAGELEIIPFEEAVESVDVSMVVLEQKDLDKLEELALRVVSEAHNRLLRIYHGTWHEEGLTLPKTVVAGVSDGALGWTDGKSYIAIERRQLKGVYSGLSGALRLVTLLVHEACHTGGGDISGHIHDADFNERFRRVMEDNEDEIAKTIHYMWKAAVTKMNQNGQKIRAGMLKAPDDLFALRKTLDSVLPETEEVQPEQEAAPEEQPEVKAKKSAEKGAKGEEDDSQPMMSAQSEASAQTELF